MLNLMVDNLDNARDNRERVREGYCNQFYNEQARCLAQWTDKKPPENLVLGELPYVGKQPRLDTN